MVSNCKTVKIPGLFFVIDQWEKQATIHPPPTPIQHLWGTKLPPCTLLYPQHWEGWGISASPELRECRANLQLLTPSSLTGPALPRHFSAQIQTPSAIALPGPVKSLSAQIPLLCLLPHHLLVVMAEPLYPAPTQDTLRWLSHHFLQPIFQENLKLILHINLHLIICHFLCMLRANSHCPNQPMFPNISRMFNTHKNQSITSPWINLYFFSSRTERVLSLNLHKRKKN